MNDYPQSHPDADQNHEGLPRDFNIHSHLQSPQFKKAIAHFGELMCAETNIGEYGFSTLINRDSIAVVGATDVSQGELTDFNSLSHSDEENAEIDRLLETGYSFAATFHFHTAEPHNYLPIRITPSLEDLQGLTPTTNTNGFIPTYGIIGHAMQKGKQARCLLYSIPKGLSLQLLAAYQEEISDLAKTRGNLTESEVIAILNNHGISGEFFSFKKQGRKSSLIFEV
jgi:hypothetical protein